MKLISDFNKSLAKKDQFEELLRKALQKLHSLVPLIGSLTLIVLLFYIYRQLVVVAFFVTSLLLLLGWST